LGIVCVVSGFPANLVLAQDNILEEVIVTAQKREQNIQDVPISIDAFSAENMQSAVLEDFGDLDTVATNVAFNEAGAASVNRSAVIYIRGIGQFDFAP